MILRHTMWPFIILVLAASISHARRLAREHSYAPEYSFPCEQEIVQNPGKVAITVTNSGCLGRMAYWEDTLASCEYPKGSGIQYLWFGALWIGGIVDGDTLVSTGHDGWQSVKEIHPDLCPRGEVVFPSCELEGAISDQDVIARFSDTLTDTLLVMEDPDDRRPHHPLHIEITQASYAWSQTLREDFVLFFCAIKNIGTSTIQDGWVGIFLDGDVWRPRAVPEGYADDLAGYLREEGIAYIIDNDGDPIGTVWDSTQSPRAAIGVKLLLADPPIEQISFNWWTSNGDARFDWGPRRAGTLSDPFRDFGTDGNGTPAGDRNKYYMLSHDEQDYDELWTVVDKTNEGWIPPPKAGLARDIADGYDARFLYSFGPFNLAPDSTFRFFYTVAMGDRIHVAPDDFAKYFDFAAPKAFLDRLDFSDLTANVGIAERLAKLLYSAGVNDCLDIDKDGLCRDDDNCWAKSNPAQEDADGDGIGDVCDNCPGVPNPTQDDIDGDGLGDVCEKNRMWYVKADGTGDAPTVQAAIDYSTHGDTIVLAKGVYRGPGNRDINLKGRRIRIKSEHGPALTVIDCEGTAAEPHRGFLADHREDSLTILEGVTIQHGYLPLSSGGGAGIFCRNSSPQAINCIFYENTSADGGGIRYCSERSGRIEECVFIDNVSSSWSGGGVACEGPVQMAHCVFLGNSSGLSLGNNEVNISNCTFITNEYNALLIWSCAPAVENCIIAQTKRGPGVLCLYYFSDPTPRFAYCDIYGNAGGDWVGCAAAWADTNGNFSADPLFCAPEDGDFRINVLSPCAPYNNPSGRLVGAKGTGCGCECSAIGDCNGDGSITPPDVAFLVSFVFMNGIAPVTDPTCLFVSRGDFNCDGRVNLVDVVGLVNFVYRQTGPGPCGPCPR